jgi:hypothetical protein
MLLKKDFEGVRSAILIQERHIRGNIDPKNRLLGVKFAKVLPANEDHVSEWSFQFAHFATISASLIRCPCRKPNTTGLRQRIGLNLRLDVRPLQADLVRAGRILPTASLARPGPSFARSANRQ